MNNKHIASALVAFSIATGLLTGCVNPPTTTAAAQSSEEFSKSMAEADLAAAGDKAGDKERAIGLYQKIATQNPSRGEPWSRIAQIHFAQGNYSLAIVAAEETLKRDPSNRQAKSVTAVGGLRLAARSLEDLRKDSSVSGDTTADAQRLAQLLRETLGTSVLVPATEPARTTTPVRRPRPLKPAKAPSAPSADAAASGPSIAPAPATTVKPVTPAKAAPAAAPAARSSGGGNPFDALK
ncbi:tetratricopeptide repeat protein [Variovorax rhizosphaerae]|uniref:Tetratricopeptide repeat protein n=1 Tax=Variovorax rhizosphaerae TaxID=1836200 RepID=A0ABU8WGZ4_9BURK